MTHEQAWEEARKRWPSTGTTLDAEGQAEGWAEEKHGLFTVGIRRFRASNVTEPKYTTLGAGSSYEAAFDDFDLKELVKFSGRLRFLSHEARDVIMRSNRRDDLNLYFQVQLIVLCCNYGAEHVLALLLPIGSKVEETGTFSNNEERIASDTPYGMVDAPMKRRRQRRRSTSEQMAYDSHKTLMQIMNPSEKDIVDGARGMSYRLKNPIRNVIMSPGAIQNLYLIDQQLLGADWTVRVEVMANLLDQVSRSTLEEIVAECSYPRMNAVLTDIEAYLGEIKRSVEELAKAPEIVVEPARPVSQKALDAFDAALKEFAETPKEET